jgi:hypothetical protein
VAGWEDPPVRMVSANRLLTNQEGWVTVAPSAWLDRVGIETDAR